MPHEASEYIIRVRGVLPADRARIEHEIRELSRLTGRTDANLSASRIDREERGTYALHLRRRKVI